MLNAFQICEVMIIAKGKKFFFCFTMYPQQSNPPFPPLYVRDASWLLNLTPLFLPLNMPRLYLGDVRQLQVGWPPTTLFQLLQDLPWAWTHWEGEGEDGGDSGEAGDQDKHAHEAHQGGQALQAQIH